MVDVLRANWTGSEYETDFVGNRDPGPSKLPIYTMGPLVPLESVSFICTEN